MANNLRQLMSMALATAGLFLCASQALALDNYKEYRRDRWDFELGAQYFSSEANFSSSGSNETLPNGNYYRLLDTYLATRYMPNRHFALYALGNVGSAESKTPVATRSNSTINEALIGADFLAYSELFQLIPEVSVLVPFEKIDINGDTVANSEGSLEVRSRLGVQKDFGIWRGYGWIGFTYRGEGRSFLMPWGVGTQFKLSSFRLGAELVGYESITDDTSNDDNTKRNDYITNINGGSLKFYGKNPQLMDTNFYATWLITKKLSLQANAGVSVMGSNSAAGFHVGGFLRYSFDLSEGYVEQPYIPIESPIPKSRANMSNQNDLSSDRKVKKFREETDDGVDQNLFRARPTKRPPRPVQDQQLQKQLDETEFQIELKGKRKKRSR